MHDSLDHKDTPSPGLPEPRTWQVYIDGGGEIVAVLPADYNDTHPLASIRNDPRHALLNVTSDPARFLDGTRHDLSDEPTSRRVSA